MAEFYVIFAACVFFIFYIYYTINFFEKRAFLSPHSVPEEFCGNRIFALFRTDMRFKIYINKIG